MQLTLNEIIKLTGGKVKEGVDGNLIVTQISTLEDANEESLSFLTNVKYIPFIYKTKARAVLVNKDFATENEVSAILIYVEDVYNSLIIFLELFNHVNSRKSGIEEPVFIGKQVTIDEGIYLGAFSYLGEGTRIGKNVKIYPNCYIGENVVIADGTILYAGVKVYTGCKIGKDCIIHSGAVIGSDGFGQAPQADGTYKKIPQVGVVIIHDRVEIGANTTIDRAAIEATIIKTGVKLDNLVMIAHNVEIGENTVIAAQSGISGSTRMGKNCVVAGQVGFAGHLEIADGSMFGAKSGISKSIASPNGKWFGIPVQSVHQTLRLHSLLQKLPDLFKKQNQQDVDIKEIKEYLYGKRGK